MNHIQFPTRNPPATRSAATKARPIKTASSAKYTKKSVAADDKNMHVFAEKQIHSSKMH